MSGTVASVAAPDEPDVAVSGGETPSGGTLRRLLSRDGNPLFGARPNGSLAPPLSVPVDPLLAGPPMEPTYLERESIEGESSGHGHGNGFSGNGSTVDVDEGPVDEGPVDEWADDEWADADVDVIEGLADAPDDPEVVDAETILADDGSHPVEADAGTSIEARTAPSPLIEPYQPELPTAAVDLVDPPATVSVPAVVPVLDAPPADAPPERSTVPPPPRRRRSRPRVRKVTRIVRYVDAWSVFKVALLLNAVIAAVMVTASVLLWNLANSTDVVDNIEGVIEDWLAYDTFAFDGQAMFRAVLVLAALFVIAATGFAVLAATLFNLISDLTGGVKVTVLEREVLAAMPPGARKIRGGAARRAAARQVAAQASSSQPGTPGTGYPTPDGSR
jgi:hypothetical protein